MRWSGTVFADRAEAGHRLAAMLEHLRGEDLVVLGLPRGGVPVALEVAQALGAPLDILVVRKLGVPFQPELGMGAVGEGGVRVVNADVVRMAGVSVDELDEVEGRERVELERRVRRYRGDRPPQPLEGRVAVVVDDGIATGSTARAACRIARLRGATRIVLAVPVGPIGWPDRIGDDADECVSVETPEPFFGIGQFYRDFSQVTDGEVADCLSRAGRRAPAPAAPGAVAVAVGTSHAEGAAAAGGTLGEARPEATRDDPLPFDADVEVVAGTVGLSGHLTVPERPIGFVLFAHGSGSSRHSPRNRYVATVLSRSGLGTVLFDLLTVDEEHSRANVFDIELLAGRLLEATRWLRAQPAVERLPIGYFGASTGAGAALWAAAEPDNEVAAIVSRGGRPDLAAPRLDRVRAPTLLVVGGWDDIVLRLNEEAKAQLRCEAELAVVPGATHLFEEPGTLQMAAELARNWFVGHFTAARAA